MKRTVIYIKALSPIKVGQHAEVIPLNHSSDLVSNGRPCITTPVQSIAPNGTTFSTKNSVYQLAAEPAPAKETEVNKQLENVQ